ncbi:MAG: RrF2 family transcriptional regulator [Spirochaetaceae bacterium]|nr:RrF2 family transcriptional regulator [Myxococcales bacterium]MCB9726606.1 RrF2 family transcriptional regulator [Spirochaetaceae bacterium]HPG26725.1 Rrf2 family transcriptional regulator [Myxococcota bacterium]
MTLLSQTSRYALQATAYMAECEDGAHRATVGDIASALGVPRNYLSKILHQLAKRGILTSTRGPGGGFRLATPPEQIRLIEIIETVEPRPAARECLLGRPVCSDTTPCSAHDRWREVNDAMTRFLEETTLADLAIGARRDGRDDV